MRLQACGKRGTVRGSLLFKTTGCTGCNSQLPKRAADSSASWRRHSVFHIINFLPSYQMPKIFIIIETVSPAEMAARLVTISKFVGSISLGLLTVRIAPTHTFTIHRPSLPPLIPQMPLPYSITSQTPHPYHILRNISRVSPTTPSRTSHQPF